MAQFDFIETKGGVPLKIWRRGVVVDEKSIEQLTQTAQLPFLYKWIAAMPDTHWGIGATVGTVMAARRAVVPAAVGVDIGCGMMAVRTDGTEIPSKDKLPAIRAAIEAAVPSGRSDNGGKKDVGSWQGKPPAHIIKKWLDDFEDEYEDLIAIHPNCRSRKTLDQLGTLGTGNHFLELSMGEDGYVWLVLHSGSRGLGNRVGTYFIELAKKACAQWCIKLPAPDLAYLPLHTPEANDYIALLRLAQRFAYSNRVAMAEQALNVISEFGISCTSLTKPSGPDTWIHCHHNYLEWEHHYGEDVMVTRKGAVRARKGDYGIIPGSMGARTYIVRGLGNQDSFCSCSHGAGRAMSRTEAVKRFSLADHESATEGVECLKDASVMDETPGAYKDIESVMAAQRDLVEPVTRLKQFLCVKGASDSRGKKEKHQAGA